jgi:hypothetical protein
MEKRSFHGTAKPGGVAAVGNKIEPVERKAFHGVAKPACVGAVGSNLEQKPAGRTCNQIPVTGPGILTSRRELQAQALFQFCAQQGVNGHKAAKIVQDWHLRFRVFEALTEKLPEGDVKKHFTAALSNEFQVMHVPADPGG